MIENKYTAIGIMSGTSLDGVDLAFCRFTENDGPWAFQVQQAETIPYFPEWKHRLSTSMQTTGKELALLHVEYGRLLGQMVKKFIAKHHLSPDFIASHGHTVFHHPGNQFTFQIGSGAEIAVVSEKPVVCDFRTSDVALGGQGAPLVPIGDQLLFPEFDYCINLGGFANISFQDDDQRLAFDICPANIVLNKLSQQLGKDYDMDGLLAASGELNEDLLLKLNQIAYYSNLPPKSLGVEWLEENFLPLLSSTYISPVDTLRTVVEHIGMQIAHSVKGKTNTQILVTGGGAYNQFLIERISQLSPQHQIILPEENIIDYKEALIFAFLGVLRISGRTNCLKSVTGASTDNIGGAVYLGG